MQTVPAANPKTGTSIQEQLFSTGIILIAWAGAHEGNCERLGEFKFILV
jgi:hypothetical protein